MSPSHTVENYLKAIFKAQGPLAPDELVQMGQLAASMGVAPGTATTMVKALADSGLARYEPYAGVRLTAAGEKLAALVLRRHRLIELFLVKVMGMSWTEVHDDAEQLEHAASDRLIELMDEMLGRPEADPHGDPIPNQDGTVRRVEYESLMTCALGEPLSIARVTGQDREFLEFAERHALRPGDVVRVEARDPAGDSVHLRNHREQRITVGARAASKFLVRTSLLMLAALTLAIAAAAQPVGGVAATRPEPFRITDNSFFVEEAFNQEAGIFQNIFGAARLNGRWAATFTQEWPAPSQTHQLSYTVGLVQGDSVSGASDTLINYRYQASLEGAGRAAFSPRLSVILPTARGGLGDGSAGLQVNLPVSKQLGEWYVHWNGGVTWLPRARTGLRPAGAAADGTVSLLSPFVAASGIYRVRGMWHLMMESVLSSDQSPLDLGTVRDTTFILAPGFRGGWNTGDSQYVIGLALPVSWTAETASTGAFLYFSYELPFGK